MEKYFGPASNSDSFELFSGNHIFILITVLVINLLFVLWFKSLKNKGNSFFRLGLAWFLIFLEVGFTMWSIYVGDWSLDYALPLHLCDAAIILTAFMLLFKKYFLYELAFFWVLGGCTQALLTPDPGFLFPHFMFFYFFIGHSIVITAVLYMTFAEGYRPFFKSIWKVFALTNLYMLVVAGVNAVTGGNYLFLCHKPGNNSIMDLMGPWPWYIGLLELMTILIFAICYLPYVFYDIFKGKRVVYGDGTKGNRSLGM